MTKRLSPVRRTLVGGFAAAVLLVGCGDGTESGELIGAPPSSSGVVPIPPPTVREADESDSDTPRARYTENELGVVLPDTEVTPGAVFDDVGPDDVCDARYPESVRKPRADDKLEVFARYGISIRDRGNYRIDHLIPVALGGTNALENLWPQPIDGLGGPPAKDALELALHALVCDGDLTLQEAQTVVAADWWQAYESYVGPVDLSPTTAPEQTTTSSTEGSGVTTGARCTEEGAIGYTEFEEVPLRCIADQFGELSWQKRYS